MCFANRCLHVEFESFEELRFHLKTCKGGFEAKKRKRAERDEKKVDFTKENEPSTSKGQRKTKNISKAEKIRIQRKKNLGRQHKVRDGLKRNDLAWICTDCSDEHPGGLLFKWRDSLQKHARREHAKDLSFPEMKSIPWTDTAKMHYAIGRIWKESKGYKP